MADQTQQNPLTWTASAVDGVGSDCDDCSTYEFGPFNPPQTSWFGAPLIGGGAVMTISNVARRGLSINVKGASGGGDALALLPRSTAAWGTAWKVRARSVLSNHAQASPNVGLWLYDGASGKLAGVAAESGRGLAVTVQYRDSITAYGDGGDLLLEDGTALLLQDGTDLVLESNVDLLLEDGTDLLLEDGTALLLEYGPAVTVPVTELPTWFEIERAGSTLYYRVSWEGLNWMEYATALTAFLPNAPTAVCLGGTAYGPGFNPMLFGNGSLTTYWTDPDHPEFADDLLLEDGTALLLEDGTNILLERANKFEILLEDGTSLLLEDGTALLLETSPDFLLEDGSYLLLEDLTFLMMET